MTRRHLKWAIPSAYVVLLLVITGVSHASRSDGPSTSVAAPVTSAPATHTSAVPSGPSSSTTAKRPNRYAGTLAVAHMAVLPDRTVTPGAVDRRVTQTDIGSTICRPGYATSIRPDAAYTTGLKIKQLDAGYAYHGDRKPGDYEEDHLISLELGGSPTSIKNLWPEPYHGATGARIKDKIEDVLHSLVCDGRVPLSTAQHAIATNWFTAYSHYISDPAHARAKARVAARARARAAAKRRAAEQRAAAKRAAEQRAARSSAAPAPTSCTRTASGSCIQGGEFCRQDEYGTQGTDAAGDTYTCTGDSTHPHWES